MGDVADREKGKRIARMRWRGESVAVLVVLLTFLGYGEGLRMGAVRGRMRMSVAAPIATGTGRSAAVEKWAALRTSEMFRLVKSMRVDGIMVGKGQVDGEWRNQEKDFCQGRCKKVEIKSNESYPGPAHC